MLTYPCRQYECARILVDNMNVNVSL